MDSISLGLGAFSIGSSLFGLFGQNKHVDTGTSVLNNIFAVRQNQLASEENNIRQAQMNLDAERRKRDVIRNAQVAQANATAIAYNQGAGNSSALAGAKSGITSQANTMKVGIEQNQELGNSLFDNKNNQAFTKFLYGQTQQKLSNQLQTPNSLAQAGTMFGNIVSSKQEDLTKLFRFGFSSI